MADEITALHRKLDDLSLEVGQVTRRLRSLDELKEDISLIANDAFSSTIRFLGEVEGHFDSRDLLALVQKSLRNLRGITSLLDQLQSMRELVEDASPLLKEIFAQVVDRLDQLERDGVLTNLKLAGEALVRMLAELSSEDLEKLGTALTRTGKAASRFATPENLDWLDRFSHAAMEPAVPERKRASLLRILLKARHPAVRRSMNHMLDAFIRASAEEAPTRRKP